MGKKRNPANGSSRIPGPRISATSSIPGPGGGSPSRIPKPSVKLHRSDGGTQPPQLSPPTKPSSIPIPGRSAIPKAGLDAACKPAKAPQSAGVNGGDSSLETLKAGGDHIIQTVEVRVRAASPEDEQFPDSAEDADESVPSSPSGASLGAAHERLLSFAAEEPAEGIMAPPAVEPAVAEDKNGVQKAEAPEAEDAAPDTLIAVTGASAPSSPLLLQEADWLLLDSQVMPLPPCMPGHGRRQEGRASMLQRLTAPQAHDKTADSECVLQTSCCGAELADESMELLNSIEKGNALPTEASAAAAVEVRRPNV